MLNGWSMNSRGRFSSSILPIPSRCLIAASSKRTSVLRPLANWSALSSSCMQIRFTTDSGASSYASLMLRAIEPSTIITSLGRYESSWWIVAMSFTSWPEMYTCPCVAV